MQKNLSWSAICNKIHEVSSGKFFRTFRQICILALLQCAVTAFQLQYWIRFGTWLWLGESRLMLMKLLGGFPITDLAGRGFQRCVWSFHIEAWQTFRSESEFDSKFGRISGFECMDFFWASSLQQILCLCLQIFANMCLQFFFVNLICLHFLLDVNCFLLVGPNLKMVWKCKQIIFCFLLIWFFFANFLLLYWIILISMYFHLINLFRILVNKLIIVFHLIDTMLAC